MASAKIWDFFEWVDTLNDEDFGDVLMDMNGYLLLPIF
jgi:hypothetical protein